MIAVGIAFLLLVLLCLTGWTGVVASGISTPVFYGITGTIFDNAACSPRPGTYNSDTGIGYFVCSILGSDGCGVNQGWVSQNGGGTLYFWVTCSQPSSNAAGTPLTIRTWSDSSCHNPLDLFNGESTYTGKNAECMSPIHTSGVISATSIGMAGGSADIGLHIGVNVGQKCTNPPCLIPYVYLMGYQQKDCITPGGKNYVPGDYAYLACQTLDSDGNPMPCMAGQYFQPNSTTGGGLTGTFYATCSIGSPTIVNFYSDAACTISSATVFNTFSISETEALPLCVNVSATSPIPHFNSYLMYTGDASSFFKSNTFALIILLFFATIATHLNF